MALAEQTPDLISRFTQHQTLIIAEAGVNHNGNLELARKLIDAADAAGADFVKFQTYRTENLVTEWAEKADYQKAETGASESQFQMLKRLELSAEMHEHLLAHCRGKSVKFLSTPFDLESVELLQKLGLPLVKIPSGELTNLPFLRMVGALGKPVFLSTGMATLEEVKAAVSVLEKAGTAKANLCVLHCTTAYPAPFAEVNLRALQTLQAELGVAVGYSDHTPGLEVPIAAVALGARVIEKHFTLDKGLPGPDHKASLEPQELTAMVKAIRNLELALGNGVKEPSKSEIRNISAVRKSMQTKTEIRKGETFTEFNLTMKRPGCGISPMYWDTVLGRNATHDLPANHLLTEKDIK